MSRHSSSAIERAILDILTTEGAKGISDTDLLRAMGSFRGEAVRFALASLRHWKVVEMYGHPVRYRLRRRERAPKFVAA